MLTPRLIPCLLIHRGGLVKTVRFGDHKYVGDPLNAVRIFNEKQVDELMVFDIDVTVTGGSPNYSLISKLACECRMPLTYGGGVSDIETISKIISLGVEKISLSSAALENPNLINIAASHIGSQSVVVTMDVKKSGMFEGYRVFTHNGIRDTGRSPLELIREAVERGAGEIVVNNIDRDGTQEGYDLDLIGDLIGGVPIPVTLLGGAGKRSDVADLWRTHGLVGAAAGSLFVLKGEHRAVLINYPNIGEKMSLISESRFN